jgi:hypothetical protein
MRVLIKNSKTNAARDKSEPAHVTPQRLVAEWESQKGLCAACRLPLSLLDAQYDHDHETGEGRGFLHVSCNMIEGLLGKIPPTNRGYLLNWMKYAIGWR